MGLRRLNFGSDVGASVDAEAAAMMSNPSPLVFQDCLGPLKMTEALCFNG
jgi:hypothetical protein